MRPHRIDHIGIAVFSLAEASLYYEKALGLTPSVIEEVPSQGVRIIFFEVGDTRIELLEPTSDESPIAAFLKKRGQGVHHIAFATDDILGALGQAKEAGCRLIHETPFEGGDHKQVAFLHPSTTFGVLTEFCQKVS